MPFKNIDPIYSVWRDMRARCLTPSNRAWPNYGGRGITICPEWDSFSRFKSDMGERPDGTSLDRIDTNGNYEPTNCRWATRLQQQRNQRRTRFVVIEGQKYKAAEISEACGLKSDTIVSRAKKGMTYEQVTADARYTYRDGWQKAVAARVANQLAKTCCKHGHEFTAQNTYFYKGRRVCRICAAAKEARRRERLRAAP